MKKIKLIIFHPYSQIGGADNSLKRLIEGLDSRLFSITFVSLNESILKKDLKKKVNFISIQNSRTLSSMPKLRKIVKSIYNSQNFRKVIVFSNQNFANIITILSLKKIKNLKTILIDRNHLDELNYSKNWIHFLKNKIILFLIKMTYRKADAIVGISKILANDLSKFIKKKF